MRRKESLAACAGIDDALEPGFIHDRKHTAPIPKVGPARHDFLPIRQGNSSATNGNTVCQRRRPPAAASRQYSARGRRNNCDAFMALGQSGEGRNAGLLQRALVVA